MYLGIDLGGTNIAAGLVDDNCKIIRKNSVPAGRTRPFHEIVKDMIELSQKIIKEEGLEDSDVEKIGIASPGIANNEKGEIVYASSFPDFRNAPVAKEFKKYFPESEVYLENDANAAAFGEMMAGAAKGKSNTVAVTLGTGVGGGIIIDKKIYSGFNNAGGEIGHKVIVCDGLECECGRRGCWEMYASGSALIRQTKEAAKANPQSLINIITNGNLEKINGKMVFDAADKGDVTANEVISKYIKYISVGIVDIINVFRPGVIVIGGGISGQGERLLSPLREHAQRESYGSVDMKTEIVAATLGNDAGIIGAAMLWRQSK
ncbi:MAG: ROK family protein [Ruminococcaceae bacterium]|nr:ROK family protein [Oscillospiraceae bacterium]